MKIKGEISAVVMAALWGAVPAFARKAAAYETASDCDVPQNGRIAELSASTDGSLGVEEGFMLGQSNSATDVEITRQIHNQIMANDSLSADSRNVKIITVDGRVTLRGPVNSEEEKQRIGDIAIKAASPANVDNQLQVKDAFKLNEIKSTNQIKG